MYDADNNHCIGVEIYHHRQLVASVISLATRFLCSASKSHPALILLLLAPEPDSRLIHEKYADRLSFTNLRPSDIFSVKYPGAQLLFCQSIAEQPQAYFFLSTILIKFKYAPPPASMALRSPTAYSFS